MMPRERGPLRSLPPTHARASRTARTAAGQRRPGSPRGRASRATGRGPSLRVKLGLDPTAPSVTLGWAVVLRKLRHFQEMGHTAVLIVGDFTAQVGDPSLMAETRRRLTAEVRGYARVGPRWLLSRLLSEPLEIRWNSEWLASMDMEHVLELTSATTVRPDAGEGRLRREDGRAATHLGPRVPLPLLQGYDSVAVEADVELGVPTSCGTS